MKCCNCHSLGHHRQNRPSPKPPHVRHDDTTSGQFGYMLAQANNKTGINANWILLDSQSTISVFKNASMLKNTCPSAQPFCAFTNGGYQDSHMISNFPTLGPVWYNPKSMTNILALAHVQKVCRITMDTSVEAASIDHHKDGTKIKFQEHSTGLYVYNPNDTNSTVVGYTMVSIVANQKHYFSRQEIKAADAAWEPYRKIGRPSAAEFQHEYCSCWLPCWRGWTVHPYHQAATPFLHPRAPISSHAKIDGTTHGCWCRSMPQSFPLG